MSRDELKNRKKTSVIKALNCSEKIFLVLGAIVCNLLLPIITVYSAYTTGNTDITLLLPITFFIWLILISSCQNEFTVKKWLKKTYIVFILYLISSCFLNKYLLFDWIYMDLIYFISEIVIGVIAIKSPIFLINILAFISIDSVIFVSLKFSINLSANFKNMLIYIMSSLLLLFIYFLWQKIARLDNSTSNINYKKHFNIMYALSFFILNIFALICTNYEKECNIIINSFLTVYALKEIKVKSK